MKQLHTHSIGALPLHLQGRVCWLLMALGGRGLEDSSPLPSTLTFSDLMHACLQTLLTL